MAFGRYIRRAREERALTLTEVARRLDISIAYLSRIEREREKPPPDRLIRRMTDGLAERCPLNSVTDGRFAR